MKPKLPVEHFPMLLGLGRLLFRHRIGMPQNCWQKTGEGFLTINDSNGLASIITELFDNPEELKELKKKAYDYGREITWPKTGEKYIALAEKVLQQEPRVIVKKDAVLDFLILPPFSLSHINRLTDDTGIIQHANFGIPNLKKGYCQYNDWHKLLSQRQPIRRFNDGKVK